MKSRIDMAPMLAAALLSVWFAAAAGAQTAFEPAVVVNDRVITKFDLDQRMRLLRMNGAPDRRKWRRRRASN
jgi:peptidyl-prolyl cis-trans isomerase SurA